MLPPSSDPVVVFDLPTWLLLVLWDYASACVQECKPPSKNQQKSELIFLHVRMFHTYQREQEFFFSFSNRPCFNIMVRLIICLEQDICLHTYRVDISSLTLSECTWPANKHMYMYCLSSFSKIYLNANVIWYKILRSLFSKHLKCYFTFWIKILI